MKPSELSPLVGRNVEVYWHGLRVAKVVAAPATDTLTVDFRGRYGRHRVEIKTVRGVFWRGKFPKLTDWIQSRKQKAGAS